MTCSGLFGFMAVITEKNYGDRIKRQAFSVFVKWGEFRKI